MSQEEVGRPIQIKGMAYAPTNEQGVVFLFGRLAPQMGFQVEKINTRFPDCLARRRGKLQRIEIEYRASDYETHRHPSRGADVILCWENDWENRPRKYQRLEINELKQYVGALPRVIAVGCDEKARGYHLDKHNRIDWSVPQYAQVNDLVVMYRTAPASEIRDLWRVVGPFYVDKKWGPQAYLRCLVRLRTPITYTMLKNDPYTHGMALVRGNFRGKRDITDEWPLLYNKLIPQNPGAKAALRDYAPD